MFFRAGALAGLEEARDELVLKLLRKMQGEVRRKMRQDAFNKRNDQRELINVQYIVTELYLLLYVGVRCVSEICASTLRCGTGAGSSSYSRPAL